MCKVGLPQNSQAGLLIGVNSILYFIIYIYRCIIYNTYIYIEWYIELFSGVDKPIKIWVVPRTGGHRKSGWFVEGTPAPFVQTTTIQKRKAWYISIRQRQRGVLSSPFGLPKAEWDQQRVRWWAQSHSNAVESIERFSEVGSKGSKMLINKSLENCQTDRVDTYQAKSPSKFASMLTGNCKRWDVWPLFPTLIRSGCCSYFQLAPGLKKITGTQSGWLATFSKGMVCSCDKPDLSWPGGCSMLSSGKLIGFSNFLIWRWHQPFNFQEPNPKNSIEEPLNKLLKHPIKPLLNYH